VRRRDEEDAELIQFEEVEGGGGSEGVRGLSRDVNLRADRARPLRDGRWTLRQITPSTP